MCPKPIFWTNHSHHRLHRLFLTQDWLHGFLTDSGNSEIFSESPHTNCLAYTLTDSSLSWSIHIDHIIKKATTRLYFLKQLKRSSLSNTHLLHFYITVIRPVLEYCVPVWHYALTQTQSESIEAVQKRTIHIIYNSTHRMPYLSMLFYANLSSLASHRENLSRVFSVISWILPLVSTVSFLHPDPQ